MGWCYLSSIIDLCTRKIVAWSFDTTAHARNTVKVLEQAIKIERPEIGLVLHTDQGVQYTSFDFEKMCVENGIIHSYSAKGTPLDNAPIESFHANLKKKEVYAKIYSSFEHAKQSLFRYIEGFYNTHRVHSSLNYLSPRDFEKQYYKQIS